MKKCCKCKNIKSLSDFYKDKNKKDGYRYNCKTCSSRNREHKKLYDLEYRRKNKEKIKEYYKKHYNKKIKPTREKKTKEQNRENWLRLKYNLTKEQYQELIKNQNNKCAICKISQSELSYPLFIDHEHKTDKVRGLLCRTCNTGLGSMQDNIEILQNAIEYLKKYN